MAAIIGERSAAAATPPPHAGHHLDDGSIRQSLKQAVFRRKIVQSFNFRQVKGLNVMFSIIGTKVLFRPSVVVRTAGEGAVRVFRM